MGSAEPAIAFATRTFAPPALEIRVNFGVFAGREATPAEIDDLGAALLDKVTEVAIVAEARHEIEPIPRRRCIRCGSRSRAMSSQRADHEVDELRGRLIETAERWARDCASNRHGEPRTPRPHSSASSTRSSVSVACSARSHCLPRS